MIFPDKNGEAVEIPKEAYDEIVAAVAEIDQLEQKLQHKKDVASAAQEEVLRVLGDLDVAKRSAAKLVPRRDVMVPVPGAVVERVGGKKENRAVKKEEIDALDATLPGRVRKREVAVIDADLLTPKQRELAEVGTKYPTVKDIDEAELNLVSKGIPLARVLHIPPDPPDVLKVTFVEGEE